jgi:uncharacterized protein YutE (UPF0331/DUF86 family)
MTRPTTSSYLSDDAMEQQAIEKLQTRYRDEGYDVIVHPQGDQVPPFLARFQLDMIATRGNKGVVVEIKANRIDLSSDPHITRLAEVVNSEPGWRLDVVILEQESQVEKAAQEASEPSDEELAQILKTADELSDKGDTSVACVVAWAGLEAAMRRIRDDAELYGKTAPSQLMRTLYGNGFLSREQFDKLKESYKIRNQVVHGLVPLPIDPGLVHYLTATARHLASGQEAAVPAN